MSINPTRSESDKIYVLDVFKEIESLIKYRLDDLVEKVDSPKIVSVINSAGSELKSYLTVISESLELEILNLKSFEITKSGNKQNQKLTSEVKESIQNFIKGITENSDKITQIKEIELNSDDANLKLQEKLDIDPLKSKMIIVDCEEILENDEMRIINEFIGHFIEIINNDEIPLQFTPMLFLIFNDIVRIPREIVLKTDLTFIIPFLSNIQRLEVLEDLLFGINIHTVDISKLARFTNGWNTLDLKKLIKVAYLKWKILNNLEIEKQNSENKNGMEEDVLKKSSNILDVTENEVKETPDLNISKGDQSNNKKLDLIPKKKGKVEEEEQKKFDTELSKFKKLHPIPLTIDLLEGIIENKIVIPLKMSPSFSLLDFLKDEMNIEKQLKNGYFFNLNAQKEKFPEKSALSYNKYNLEGRKNELDNFKGNLEQSPVYQRGINITEISSFSTNQLYQFAASNKFEELIIVLEKLSDGKNLDDLDRNILSDFPFVLKDDPKRSIIKLTNAKNRIDRIKKISSNFKE